MTYEERGEHRAEHPKSPVTAVPPGAPGAAGDTHTPVAPDGRDGKDDGRVAAVPPTAAKSTTAHSSRPGPAEALSKPASGIGANREPATGERREPGRDTMRKETGTDGPAGSGRPSPRSADDTPRTAPGADTAEPRAAQLLSQHEREQLEHRLQHAVTRFVDSPRHAVEEAADVLEDAGDRLAASLAEHGRALRSGWQHDSAGSAAAGDDRTEELRLALRSYREVTERLLRI